jgi:hypothetical protein
MPYCQKCGNKVDENMTFCPRCGASLRDQTAQSQTPPPTYRGRNEKGEKNEKNEKNQQQEKGEKHEKGQTGYVGFLIGGLVLIVIGFFSLLNAWGYFNSVPSTALFLLVIGVIIIIAAAYLASTARKRFPPPTVM